MPLRPAGKSEDCQLRRRSTVRGSAYFCVASSIISTAPSTSWLVGVLCPLGRPMRRAMEERTEVGSKTVPSMALDLITSEVRLSKLASLRKRNPKPSIFPISRPWRCRTFGNTGSRSASRQVKCGQSGC